VGYFYVNLKQGELRYPLRIFLAFQDLRRQGANLHGSKQTLKNERRWQHLYLLATFLPLSLTYGFLTHLYFVPHQIMRGPGLSGWLHSMGQSGPEGAFGVLCCLCLLAVLLHISYRTAADFLGRAATLPRKRPLLSGALLILFGTALGAVCLFVSGWPGGHRSPAPGILLLNRLGNPGYGLSPAVPLICLFFSLSLWGYCGLRRVFLVMMAEDPRLIRKLCPEQPPFDDPAAKIGRLALHGMLSSQRTGSGLSLLVIAACAVLLYPVLRELTTLEGWALNLSFMIFFGLLYGLVVRAHVRFLMLWFYFQRFLRFLSAQPMVDAYDRLPIAFSRSIGIQLLERIPVVTELEALWRHFVLLSNHFGQFESQLTKDLTTDDGTPTKALDRFKQQIEESKDYASWDEDRRQAFFLDIYDSLSAILERFWGKRPLRAAVTGKLPAGGEPGLSTTNTATLYMRLLPDEVHLWLRLAEDFIAIQVVTYISHVFPLLRTLLVFVLLGMLLLLLSLNIYPFQPLHLLLSLSWVMILSIVALTLTVFVQMNRNEVLSRIAKSEPGKVTWDRFFIAPLLLYIVLPLLTLVSSQLPEVRGPLFSWIEPFLRALK
jgi:hypothetical protein